MVYKDLCILVLWITVALALDGCSWPAGWSDLYAPIMKDQAIQTKSFTGIFYEVYVSFRYFGKLHIYSEIFQKLTKTWLFRVQVGR